MASSHLIIIPLRSANMHCPGFQQSMNLCQSGFAKTSSRNFQYGEHKYSSCIFMVSGNLSCAEVDGKWNIPASHENKLLAN